MSFRFLFPLLERAGRTPTDCVSEPITGGETFTHEVDFTTEFTIDTVHTGGAIDLYFRKQDASNYLRARLNTTYSWRLYEIVGGVSTALATGSAHTPDNGERIIIKLEGTSFEVYRDGVLYTSATTSGHFLTETDGDIVQVGDAVVTDCCTYPL